MNSCSIAYEFLCAYCIILQTTTWSVQIKAWNIQITPWSIHSTAIIQEIDEIVIIFVYSKKNFFLLEDTNNCFDYNR